MKLKLLIAAAVLVFGLSSASAITMVAGTDFQDNAFADTVISSQGTYNLVGAATLSAAVTGSSLTKYADVPGFAPSDFIQLGFTDNYLVNGAGNDLAIFTIFSGGLVPLSVTINGVTKTNTPTSTFTTTSIGGTSFVVDEVAINLDDFNVAFGAQLSSIKIGTGLGDERRLDLSVVAAINSAPVVNSVPDAGSTISMLGAALAGLGLLNWKLPIFRLIK